MNRAKERRPRATGAVGVVLSGWAKKWVERSRLGGRKGGEMKFRGERSRNKAGSAVCSNKADPGGGRGSLEMGLIEKGRGKACWGVFSGVKKIGQGGDNKSPRKGGEECTSTIKKRKRKSKRGFDSLDADPGSSRGLGKP